MLCSMNDVLHKARKHHYCVPAFDCVPDIYVRALLEAAEEAASPLILSVLPADLHGRHGHHVTGLIYALAPHFTIPLVLHLDHAKSLEEVALAISLGCNAVMIDASHQSFEENVDITSQVVRYAHARGVTVEAELGHVAGSELASGADTGSSVLTDPAEVAAFVAATNVDALAVSIGTAHGVYQSLPNLDIDVLKAINAASSVPLVLHGGSGVPEEQVNAAIANGICKLNIYADLRLAMNKALSLSLDISRDRADAVPEAVFEPLHQAIKSEAAEKIRLCQSEGKA